MCWKRWEIGIKGIGAYWFVIRRMHRYDDARHKEAVQRVLRYRFTMWDKMRCSIDMCAGVRTNVQLANTPGRGCVSRGNAGFGIPRKVHHAVFNEMGQIKVLSHGPSLVWI